MVKGTIIVRIETDIQVILNEGVSGGRLTEEERERAIEAAISPIPQQVEVFLDGRDIEPAKVFFDVTDSDVESVIVELD